MKPLRALLAVSAVAVGVLGWASAAAWGSGAGFTGSVTDPVDLSGAFAVAVSGHYAYASAYYPG